MDTQTFLKTILPTQGVYMMVLINTRGVIQHKAFASPEKLAEGITHVESLGYKGGIYHACASFRHPYIINAKGKKEYRTKANTRYVKSFWLDIDIGAIKAEKGKGYASKKEAANELSNFCRDAGLPMPLLISSGHGLHCYWVMDEDIPASDWRRTAKDFELVLMRRGLLVDDSATSDSQRILRPVGTHNRKPDLEVKPVRCLREAKPLSFEWFKAAIARNMGELGILSEEQAAEMNSQLAPYEGVTMPSLGEVIATKCQQVKAMAQTQGDVSYEVWRAGVGLTKFCEEGITLAEKWTERRHEAHEKTDYQREWDTWESGPPTCQHFERHNSDGCAGCPHKGNIKSPIVLGRYEPDTTTQADDSGQIKREIDTPSGSTSVSIPALPKGYDWKDGMLVRCIPIPEEERVKAVPFSHTLFYGLYLVTSEDGSSEAHFRAHLPNKGRVDFSVPQGLCNGTANEALRVFGNYQIVRTDNKEAGESFMAYLRAWINKLQRETPMRKSVAHFGWDKNLESFSIGSRAYMPDGTVTDIVPTEGLKTLVDTFPDPKGALQEWTDTIHAIFSSPKERHRQYAIANAFGCVLTPLCTDSMYRGVVFAITGGRTAKGKTTTAVAAMSAFGNPALMTIGGDEGATTQYKYGQMGLYKNLPMLVDDVSHMEPKAISQFCYDVSMGTGKKRLRSTNKGVVPADQFYWAMSPFVTANIDLHGLLSSYASNTAAEAVRMVEIYIDEHQFDDKERELMNARVRKLNECQGAAGDAFIQYVVTHRDEVQQVMDGWASRLGRVISDSEYRNYRSHAECTLSALEICNKLGILNFDVEAVYQYAMDLFGRLAVDVLQNHTLNIEDAVGDMINSMAPHTAVTGLYKDARHAEPDKLHNIKDGLIYGRAIIGEANANEQFSGRLYLSHAQVKSWCFKNRLSPGALIAEIKRLGLWVDLDDQRFVLGRGTTMSTGQTRCICLRFDKMNGLYGDQMGSMAWSETISAVEKARVTGKNDD